MGSIPSRTEVVSHLEGKPIVTVAAGTTCGSLGDERNLREFLVADDVVRELRNRGVTVHFLLFDDNLDELTEAQLRVAVEKNETLFERFKPFCGKPICSVPDPFGCHESLSKHFEEKLLERLHKLRCYPTLIRQEDMYRSGMYQPYLQQVLRHAGEINAYIAEQFDGYQPESLFYVICPICGYIDGTSIELIANDFVNCSCGRCGHFTEIPLGNLRGKFNYKLDCAIRWKLMAVDAETFGKPYMEPRSGSYYVSQGIAKRFFEGSTVWPLTYGQVKVSRDVSYRLIESLPPELLREMMLERPFADIVLTRDRALLVASRVEIEDGLSYLEVVKQRVPAWLLNPMSLNAERRELLESALNFAVHILNKPLEWALPASDMFEGESEEVLMSCRRIVREALALRRTLGDDWEAFRTAAKQMMKTLGPLRHPTLHRLRTITRQTHGVPASKFLFHLPVPYLELVHYILMLKTPSVESELPKTALVLIDESATLPKKGRALLSD